MILANLSGFSARCHDCDSPVDVVFSGDGHVYTKYCEKCQEDIELNMLGNGTKTIRCSDCEEELEVPFSDDKSRYVKPCKFCMGIEMGIEASKHNNKKE